MSLAAPIAGSGPRPASFLPAITCSSCGEEIEIAAMGDHICGPTAMPTAPIEDYTLQVSNPYALEPSVPQPISMPPMPSIPDHVGFEPPQSAPSPRARAPTLSSNPGNGARMLRAPLPKINPEAANKPFLAPMNDSPMSPALSVRSTDSGRAKPAAISKSAISPTPRLYNPLPPSPELSANIDCAFPPFPPPSGSTARPSTSNGRKTPIDRAPSRGASRPDRGLLPGQGSFDLEPKSPRLNAGESVMQRLNTLTSGPFNAKKSKSSSGDSKPGPFSFGRRRPSHNAPSSPPTQPLQPAVSERSNPDIGIQAPGRSSPPLRPARPTTEEVFSPKFLDQFSSEPDTIHSPASPQAETAFQSNDLSRSHTQPLPEDHSVDPIASEPLSKVQSEPTLPNLEIESTLAKLSTPQPFAQPFEPPQRQASLRNHDGEVSTRSDYRIHDAPPVPRALQQRRHESIHAPSESGYSTVSSSNSTNHSNSSRRPSPVTSAASSVDAFSPLSYDPSKYGEDEQMRVPDLNVHSSDKFSPVERLPPLRSPPRNFARPVPPRSASPPVSAKPPMMPLESPMDPALQAQSGVPSLRRPSGGSSSRSAPIQTDSLPGSARKSPMPPAPPLTMPNKDAAFQSYRPGLSMPGERQPRSGTESPQRGMDVASPVTNTRSPLSARSPDTPLDPQMRPGSRRANSARPVCRGCGQAIEGKSVKASDGRLTGRWHKACFVCRSCRSPFTTADFYVLNNEPYCEQHYHEHNGSLCAGCHRGIEGQFIETSSTTRADLMDKKFHPRCFTCWECRSVLSDDYFEISGKVFCERHALAAMRAQAHMASGAGHRGLAPPHARGLQAERRTTRLMMMA